MAALFLLMFVPMVGWYFLGEFTSRDAAASRPAAERVYFEEVQGEVRLKLALTLAASVLALGVVIAYLRRTVIDPLTSLAERARRGGKTPWESPPERDRPDEIGDLARALDVSVRSLESKAERAVRFATDLSHELRTPLSAIRGAAEILSDPALEPADRSRFVANIQTESDRLERLAVGLLEMERAEAGETPPRGERLRIQPLLEGLRQRTAPLLDRKALRLELDCDDLDLALTLDGDRLQRIILGLLENAIRFSPEGGVIDLTIAAREGAIELALGDQGPGIPPELADRIFDRRFSGGDPESGYRGTGLGLAIVRSLVVAAGGEIEVAESAGGGALFRCTLPLEPASGGEIDL
jgi:two-component system sensor histidine kinase CreC